MKDNCRRISVPVLLLAAFVLVSAGSERTDSRTWIEAITAPSADVTLSFVQPGRIAEVHIKEGDVVEADQMLIRQDSSAEQALLMQIKAESEDTTQIEAAEATLAQKEVDLKKIEWAAGRGSATELELEHARLDVKIAKLSLKVAEFNHEQSKLKYQESQIRVDNMSLKSPIAGVVDKVDLEVGEAVSSLVGVVRIVKTSTLWIDAHVPLSNGMGLKVGQSAEVLFSDPDRLAAKGKIIFVSTVADAASSTLRVRIEVPNKTNRPAGEHVRVAFATP
ncbi:MAG: efflux RND transporter periplasmic adaptor subunit [Sedimentisphaerales bacterium]|nr:efflux RND transporter periplasmic adaptor subunit [Sedimentisphaerales bacterium]